MHKISALVNYYNDLGFLRLLDESGQLDIYDEIVLVDGPYAYVSEHPLWGLSTQYLDGDVWGREFISRRNITYIKNVWDNEEDKRTKGYDACLNDLIILQDTDEFYRVDEKELDNFCFSDKGVASFVFQNLCLGGYLVSKKIVIDIKDFPLRAFVFKRNLIDSLSHLDYLWLIGAKQNKMDSSMLYMPPLALGYHFTQMRDLAGQIQKYSFYISLYNSTHAATNNNRSAIVKSLTKLVANGQLSVDEARLIYLRSNIGFTGTMQGEGNMAQQRVVFSDYLETLCELIAERRYRFKSNFVYKIMNGWPCFFFLENNISTLSIKADLVEKFVVRKTIIPLNAIASPPQLCVASSLGEYQFVKDSTIAGYLIELSYFSGREMSENDTPIDVSISYD